MLVRASSPPSLALLLSSLSLDQNIFVYASFCFFLNCVCAKRALSNAEPRDTHTFPKAEQQDHVSHVDADDIPLHICHSLTEQFVVRVHLLGFGEVFDGAVERFRAQESLASSVQCLHALWIELQRQGGMPNALVHVLQLPEACSKVRMARDGGDVDCCSLFCIVLAPIWTF